MATLNFPDDPSTGDVYKDGNSGFSYKWNGTVWISTDPSTASNIREIDDISSGFDGSDTTFTLQVAGVNVEPANVQQLIISVGGVMQNAGQDFTLSGSTLTFTTAPSASLTFFGVLLGTALSLNTVADGSVGSASLKTEDFTIGGSGNTVTIPGNLTVQGTETIINTNELNVQDKTIGIGSTNAPTAASQDGAGAIIYGQTHIDILYDVDKAALGISTGVSVAGFVTATRAQVGTGVTINNTGIDAGNAGIVTAGTIAAPSALTLKSSATTTAATIDTSSRLLIGHTANITDYKLQVIGDDGNASLALSRFTNNSASSLLEFNKSRNGSIGSNTVVQDGDTVGVIRFKGADGTDYAQVADIQAAVDGTPGDNDMPGCLIFGTTADGAQYTTERLRITSSGTVGINSSAPKSTLDVGGNAVIGIDQVTDNPGTSIGITTIRGHHVNSDSEYARLHFSNSKSAGGGTAPTASIRAGRETGNYGTNLSFYTNSTASAGDGAERLKVTSTGGFQFSNGLFDEKVNITAGKLSGNQDINLANGMVHYFTTQEDGTATPNIRIDGSNTLQDAMDTGDVCTVTLITTAAAAGYSANLTIDGNAVTEEWVGGEAPSEGGADGLDIYAYTIICIGTGTGDSGFKVIANLTNATN